MSRRPATLGFLTALMFLGVSALSPALAVPAVDLATDHDQMREHQGQQQKAAPSCRSR